MLGFISQANLDSLYLLTFTPRIKKPVLFFPVLQPLFLQDCCQFLYHYTEGKYYLKKINLKPWANCQILVIFLNIKKQISRQHLAQE